VKLCKFFGLCRSEFYYIPAEKKVDSRAENRVIEIFNENRKVYGQKKIREEMRKEGYVISKGRIKKIMNKYGLVSKYNQRRRKRPKNEVNNDEIPNNVNREFGGRKPLEVVVSDLTYINVKGKWNYVCLLTELAHREIIGFSAGENRDANLVEKAFSSVKIDLRKVNYFHTDRGSEFKNELIEKKLQAFGINRSLSRPGTPIDNAVAESMYGVLKTEFVFGEDFSDVYDLQDKLEEWVWWYNNRRIHGSLGFMTPVQSRNARQIGVPKSVKKKWRKY
jgi:transposase InsO family protein